MQVKIETWFPKSLYIVDDLNQDLILPLEESIKSLLCTQPTARNGSLNVSSSHRTNRKLHLEDGVFKILSKEILLHVKEYARQLGYSENFTDRCFMADMWYNVSGQGDYIFPHSHPGSFFSGAFYVKSIPENKILFYDALDQYVELPSKPNQLSFVNATYDCTPNRLIIFRSNFLHGVPAQMGEGEKIVISFNVVYAPEFED